MTRTVLSFMVVVCTTATAWGVDLPKAPDFQKRVNYVSWYRDQLPDVSGSNNAYNVYAAFMPNIEASKVDEADWPRFYGMMTMPDQDRLSAGMTMDGGDAWPPGPGPWRSELHEGWNGSYERTKDVLKKYREAAKRKALVAPVKLSGDGREGRLVSLRFPYTQYQQQCAMGLFEGAWQVTDEGVSIKRMRSAIDTNLRTANQMNGCLSVEEQSAAMMLRLETYRNIRWAFALGVLNEGNASKVAKLLRRIDGERVDCSPAVSGDCAKWLDGLQYIFGTGNGGKGNFDGNRYRDITGQSMGGGNRFGIGARLETDPVGSGNAIHAAYEEIGRKFLGQYSNEKAGEIRQAFDRMASATNVNKGMLMSEAGRIQSLYASAGRAEVERRGAILVADLFAYKSKHGKWPAALKDLGSAASDIGEDSYSGNPFVYVLSSEEPFLYSVGPNGVDDGGAPDDVLLWPIRDSELWIASCAMNLMGTSELTKLSDVKSGLKDQVIVIEAEVQGVANEINKEHGRLHRVNVYGQGTSQELIYYDALQQELKPHQTPETGKTYRIRCRVVELDGGVKLRLEKALDLAPAF